MPSKEELIERYKRLNIEKILKCIEYIEDEDVKMEKKIEIFKVAIILNKLSFVKELLNEGIDANEKFSEGGLPLGLACYIGNIEIVKFLLEKVNDINEVDNEQRTALHWACVEGNRQVVEILLQKGIDVNKKDRKCNTAIKIAVINNDEGLTKLLLDNGAKVNLVYPNGGTTLHIACARGNLELINMLYQKGADINAKTKSGLSPLHVASSKGYIKVVKELIKRGADVNSTAENGETPLLIASRLSNFDTVEILLKNEAYINVKSRDNISALHWACTKTDMKMIKLLVNKGINKDIQSNILGDTALHILCRKGYEEGISFLVEKGANVDIRNSGGKIPIDILYEENLSDIACIVAPKSNAMSPRIINWAIDEENLELLKIMISKENLLELVLGKLVARKKKHTLRVILKELLIRDVNVSIRKRIEGPNLSRENSASLLGIAVANNSIEISDMLMEYNFKKNIDRARRLSDVLHNEDANELLKEPLNMARNIIKKRKEQKEKYFMLELKIKNEEAYNKYKSECQLP
ncbi:MAG: ankyrin repeat domain-containing protein [Clostridiales bacterium]|nr:ankyrin repeat domain-containing protein [Clostridiales bacterium]